MKQFWLWIIFIVAYGTFSMKTHAAVSDAASHAASLKYGWGLPAQGR
ncbi:MAG: hypothetical protein KJ795_13990 [Gammaproteobacteria bacterium]|nr:hypothetical protein [Gammaproteobacteria bacterium]MBU1969085.1 hypothetical protein [Gammaproteobacteria bacterium]